MCFFKVSGKYFTVLEIKSAPGYNIQNGMKNDAWFFK